MLMGSTIPPRLGTQGLEQQMANHPNRSKTYTYSAYTAQQDGVTHTHTGVLSGAIRKAKAYAVEAFPAWQYAGYGPTIVVRDAAGTEVHRERL